MSAGYAPAGPFDGPVTTTVAPGEAMSVASLVNPVLRRRRGIARAAVAVAFVVGTMSFLGRPTFTSNAVFAPQARRSVGNLAGLAAQFGVALPGAEPTQVPQFYADLVTSYSLLGAVVDNAYRVPTDSGVVQGNLVRLLRAEGKSPALRREDAIRRLRRAIAVTPNQKTGVVRLTVKGPSAELAQSIGTQILAEVNRYNLSTRTSQARAERQFTESRLADARNELRRAENELATFRLGNRAYQGAPGLELQAQRLEREVSLRQQVYTTLATAYEQARIDEVRDTPVITVVEPPALPVQRDGRGTVRKAILAFLGVTILGVVLAIVSDRVRRAGITRPPGADGDAPVRDEMDELRDLVRGTWRDLLRPWRFLLPSRS